MNQVRAVDGVFAVVAGVMMAAGSVDVALAHEREQIELFALMLRRGLRRVIGLYLVAVVGNGVPGEA